MTQERVELIEQRLCAALEIDDIHIVDDSAAHAGHAGARSGGGHFSVTIVSPAFAGKSRIQRHRLVFDAVDDLMQKEIHALSIKAFAPDEI